MIEQNLGSNTKISLICRVVHMELNCELNKMPCLKISQETLYYKQQVPVESEHPKRKQPKFDTKYEK